MKAEQNLRLTQKATTAHVPTLEIDSKYYLSESLAIIDWIGETYKDMPLYPESSMDKALFRASSILAAGTQPVQNLKVLKYLSDDAEKRKQWAAHFITEGLSAYENA